MPGGVNSPVRAFKNIKSNPIFFKSAKGYIKAPVTDKYTFYILCDSSV